MTAEAFEAVSLPRKDLAQPFGRYRVYSEPGKFTLVEAANALEALKASGLPQAHRIERDTIYLTNVLDVNALAKEAPPSAAPAAEVAEAAAAPQEDAPAAAPVEATTAAAPATAEAPLSGDQVSQLLQGQPATGA